MTLDRLCSHIIQLAHTPIRVYNLAGERTAIYGDHPEQKDVLDCDAAFLQMLLSKCPPEDAVLYLEAERILYGLAATQEEIYLMGPCCLGWDSVSAAQDFARAHKMDTRKPYRISSVSLTDFSEMLLLLFEMATGRTMDQNQLWHKSFSSEQMEREINGKFLKVFNDMQENAAVHNPYDQEKREQESIRTGDLEGLHRSLQETYVGKHGTLAHNSLRQAKNIAIVLVTLASRSAMEGGVPPETAYSMSDAYIQKVEELRNEGKIIALARQAEEDYCILVHQLSASRQQNALVKRCKELIVQHMNTKISVSELAEELNINPNYLSQLFVKAEGINLSDYIAREKIAFAKKLLKYTDDSYGTIALSLGFFSQSHFGRVFKKWTEMTPRQYREKYGRKESKIP